MTPRFLTAAFVFLIACNDRTTGDTEPDEQPDEQPNDIGPSDSSGATVCRQGRIACEGECFDPLANDLHCGECGHACRDAWYFGGCNRGSCPPSLACGPAEADLHTCDDVCAFNGQECVDKMWTPDQPCGGAYWLYFDEENPVTRCETRVGGGHTAHGACNDPIAWDTEGGLTRVPATAVACCCTQDPL